jgi:peptidoglycan/LPS O-acetylase OafA/YrhL
MTATADAPGSTTRPGGERFRPDIEGLRGVAILLVLLFHAGLSVPGGFIGVDVFFVISGFLITGLLLREREATGTIAFARFYARRVRRLLPAGALVLLATLPVAFAVLGPLDRSSVMLDGAAAALSVGNLRFALAESDYFSAIGQPSPFLHFWSLAVEEQFYLVWPAIVFVVLRAGRRWLGVVLLVILGASLVLNVEITRISTPWAFYSLPTRAWQLALGGLLAVAGVGLDRLPVPLRSVVGWLAMAGLAASALLLDGDVPYPGVAAITPTLCAALLIVAGTSRFGPGVALTVPPLRWLGRISYSLYLWHWPILVLVRIALGDELPVEGRVLLVVASVIVSALSWRFVEERFRRPRQPGDTARPVLALGGATLLIVAVLGGSLAYGHDRLVEAIALAAPPEATPSAPLPTPSPQPSPTPARATASPGASPTVARPSPTPEPTPPPITWTEIPDVAATVPIPLPAGVRPPLSRARSDIESVWRDRCGAQVETIEPPRCVYGAPAGSLTVALVGDSHAGQWFPAFEALATSRGWRLEPFVKLSCPFVDMRVENFDLKREYTECVAWRDRVTAILLDDPPDIVVVAMSHRGIFSWLNADKSVTRQGEAIGRALARLPGRVLLMIDTPRTSVDIPGCLAAHPTDIRPCAFERKPSFTDSFGEKERIAAELSGAGLIDVIPAICPSLPCQTARDGMIVFRDNHHLTATFSASLEPAIDDALRSYVEAILRPR